jgi:hypothetical protein
LPACSSGVIMSVLSVVSATNTHASVHTVTMSMTIDGEITFPSVTFDITVLPLKTIVFPSVPRLAYGKD